MLEREPFTALVESTYEWQAALSDWENAPFGTAEYDRAMAYANSCHRHNDQLREAHEIASHWDEWALSKSLEMIKEVQSSPDPEATYLRGIGQ